MFLFLLSLSLLLLLLLLVVVVEVMVVLLVALVLVLLMVLLLSLLFTPDVLAAQSVHPVSLGIYGVSFGSHSLAEYTGGCSVFGTC